MEGIISYHIISYHFDSRDGDVTGKKNIMNIMK